MDFLNGNPKHLHFHALNMRGGESTIIYNN